MPYEDIEGIGYGSAVHNTGSKLLIPVADSLIGRTVDALGQPIDGGPPVEQPAFYPITGVSSNPMDRPRIDTAIQMGVKAIDGLLTIGKGQRMGIFAGSGVAKYADGYDCQKREGGCERDRPGGGNEAVKWWNSLTGIWERKD